MSRTYFITLGNNDLLIKCNQCAFLNESYDSSQESFLDKKTTLIEFSEITYLHEKISELINSRTPLDIKIKISLENSHIVGEYYVWGSFKCIHQQKYQLQINEWESISVDELKMWDIFLPKNSSNKKWYQLSSYEKEIYLTLIRRSQDYRYSQNFLKQTIPKDRIIKSIILDGEMIKSETDFFIHLGEALNGTWGYYGANLAALDDCLCGNFGVIPPFTIVWNNSDKSNKYLSREIIDGKSFWDDMLEIFNKAGVTLELK